MAYPPHVRRLLISLPKDQVRFQLASIELLLALRILMGMCLVASGMAAVCGIMALDPRALWVLAHFGEGLGIFGATAYVIACAASLAAGLGLVLE